MLEHQLLQDCTLSPHDPCWTSQYLLWYAVNLGKLKLGCYRCLPALLSQDKLLATPTQPQPRGQTGAVLMPAQPGEHSPPVVHLNGLLGAW